MKKSIVYYLILALVCASCGNSVSDVELTRAKTVCAYHVDKLLLPDKFTEEKCPQKESFNDIKSRIAANEMALKLTDCIEKSDPKGRNVKLVYKYYTHDIFDEDVFKGRLTDAQKKEIQKKLKDELTFRTSANIKRKGKASESSSNFPLVSTVLAIGALAMSLYLYRELREVKRNLDTKNKRRKEEIGEIGRRLSQLENDILKSKKQITDMKQQVLNNSDTIMNIQHGSEKAIEPDQDKTIHREPQKEKTIATELYAGVPTASCFKATEVYSAKTIYKIILHGDSSGDFEFIDRPEAVAIAQQSKTSFLEPACNVLNNDLPNFSKIITKEKGKVEKRDNGWHIVKKAVIRLA